MRLLSNIQQQMSVKNLLYSLPRALQCDVYSYDSTHYENYSQVMKELLYYQEVECYYDFCPKRHREKHVLYAGDAVVGKFFNRTHYFCNEKCKGAGLYYMHDAFNNYMRRLTHFQQQQAMQELMT